MLIYETKLFWHWGLLNSIRQSEFKYCAEGIYHHVKTMSGASSCHNMSRKMLDRLYNVDRAELINNRLNWLTDEILPRRQKDLDDIKRKIAWLKKLQ
jgi:hypothetical protein